MSLSAAGTIATANARANLGARQERLQCALARLSSGCRDERQAAMGPAQPQVAIAPAAEGGMREADAAGESGRMARFGILTQSGLASLAQANRQSAAGRSRCAGGERVPTETNGGWRDSG